MNQPLTGRPVEIRPDSQPRHEDRIRAAVANSNDPAVQRPGYAAGAVRQSRRESRP